MSVVEVLDPVAPARAGGWKVDVSRGERNRRVSSEWFNRPDDERYLSLDDLWANVKGRSERSRSRVVQTADIRVEATRDNSERLNLMLPKAHELVAPTHWAFGQLASIVGAPASYLRQLPAPLAGIEGNDATPFAAMAHPVALVGFVAGEIVDAIDLVGINGVFEQGGTEDGTRGQLGRGFDVGQFENTGRAVVHQPQLGSNRLAIQVQQAEAQPAFLRSGAA